MLPTKGRPFGPGGSGMALFRRLNQTHASIAGMRINAVPAVGLKAMMSAGDYFLSINSMISNILVRCDTMRHWNPGVAKVLLQTASDT